MQIIALNFYLVPDGIDDGSVAFQCGDEYSVCWGNKKTPERESSEPHVTNDLITDPITWHPSAAHLDDSGQQSPERSTHVYDALVHDQNVDFLNNVSNSEK